MDKTDNQPLTQLGNEILSTARNELYLSMRFLDVALAGLTFEMSPLIASTATDGEKLYFQPRYLMDAYEENPVLVNRAYLHNLLHCIFSHLYLSARAISSLWDLCCDICVEFIMDSLSYPSVRKMQSPIREKTYRYLEDKVTLYTPGRLYHILDNSVFYKEYGILMTQDFCIDTHEYWPKEKDNEGRKRQQKNESRWQEVSDKTRTAMETFERRAGTNAGKLLQTLQVTRPDEYRYDYFLRRFAAWHEEMKINDEEFDLSYYKLGIDLYQNIPLLEPLEYKEEKKIQELVIAVDTSGSCYGTQVRRFLNETYAILKNSHRFFRHIRIHLLQFDTVVQEDTCITDMAQLAAMPDSFTVKGFGGTDYRCVFRYIEGQRKAGRFAKLQGLMILTDGYGTYPKQPPDYPTAFLLADYLKEDSPSAREPSYEHVPSWAIRLRLDEALSDE